MIVVASFFLLAGVGFSLIAAIGVLRMPDVYCRMHAATKAGAFGACLMILSLLVAQPSLRLFIQGFLLIAFFYLTAPVAAQMLGRVAILRKIPLWQPQESRERQEDADPFSAHRSASNPVSPRKMPGH